MTTLGLHPHDDVRPTQSEAERKVYAALKLALPKGWSAWHSLRIRVGATVSGEGDFVIAAPDRGMLVLEVKGGSIEQRDGRWFQNGTPMAVAPRDQALGFQGKLVERLLQAGCAPPAYGVATLFPDTEFENPPSQDDLRGGVLGAQDLSWFGAALPELIERALPPPRAARGPWIDTLHALWGETWTPRLSLGRKKAAMTEDRVALDAKQLDFLEMAWANERVLVEGGAGTGKTLLALEATRRLASEGKRPLLLCFTAALGVWLARQLEGTTATASTVRQLAKDLLVESGEAIGDVSLQATWDELPPRAAELITKQERRWDCVVLDEAQDLPLGDWMLVDAIAGSGRLWAFFDPAQSFWDDRAIDRSLFPATLKLTTAYRTPSALLAVAQSYARGAPDVAAVQTAIDAGQFAIVTAPSESSVPNKISDEIERLLSEGLKPSDIAIVSLRGASPPDSVIKQERIGRHRLVRADDPKALNHIVADTFLRFKGLERPAIIVTDLRLVQDKKHIRMYIALTRALVTARIVAPTDVLRSDSMLPPV